MYLSKLLQGLSLNESRENDRASLFNEQARQVGVEERYERKEKLRYKQNNIPIEIHVYGKKLKVYLIDLKEQLPALKKGQPISLTYRVNVIYTYFEELTSEYIILALTCDSWKRYEGLTRVCGQANFTLELAHNEDMYLNKIGACRAVEMSESWIDALVPKKLAEFSEQDEKIQPDLLDHLDSLTGQNIVCLNEKLTFCQKNAIVNMLKAKNRPQPYVLFGPPGTGKTVTLAELVLQIYTRSSKSQVLVCGNSNICVDLLAQRIYNYNIIEKKHIVRLMAGGRLETDTVISPEVKAISMIGATFRDPSNKPRIVLTTCQKASFLNCAYQFDYVIVDEVGHCQEPETLIPILLRKLDSGSIVLGGDPHQLQPVSKPKDAPLLAESILDRLFDSQIYKKQNFNGQMRYDERYITKLLDCHRSDGRIMRINNKLFYDDEMKFTYKTPSLYLDIFQTIDPLLFSPVYGIEETISPKETSKFNKAEARRCIDFVRIMYNAGLKPEHFGIIAAYRGQVSHISSLFERYDLDRCKVATIDEFQGEEKDIIIISTVRSSRGKLHISEESLGFLKQYRRFNVAVSRAKAVAIVIGDPNILRLDKNWAAYIDKATELVTKYSFVDH